MSSGRPCQTAVDAMFSQSPRVRDWSLARSRDAVQEGAQPPRAALRRGEQDTQPCPLARRAPGQAPRSTRAAGRLASAGVGVGLHGAMHRLPTRDTVMRAGCPRARGRRSGGEPGRSTLSPVAWAVDADAGGSRLSALATRRGEACEHAVRMPAVRSPAAAARWSGRAGWSAGLPPPCSRARRTPNQLVPTSRAKAPAAVSAV
jgi:hypothetical protein